MSNKMQQECTGILGDPEFTIEPLYGVRVWYPGVNDRNGPRLSGMYEYHWPVTRALQTAVCGDVKRDMSFVLRVPLKTVEPDYVHDAVTSAYDTLFPSIGVLLGQLKGSIVKIHLTHSYVFESEFKYDTHNSYALPLEQLASALEHIIADKTKDMVYYAQPSVQGVSIVTAIRHVEISLVISDGKWSHPVTHPNCTCGFYAYHAYKGIETNIANHVDNDTNVAGLVEGTGRATLGTYGWRAEHSRILALKINPEAHWRYVQAANAANIQVVTDVEDLYDLARRRGILLDQ